MNKCESDNTEKKNNGDTNILFELRKYKQTVSDIGRVRNPFHNRILGRRKRKCL